MTKLLQLLADNRQRAPRARAEPILILAKADGGSTEATIYLYDSIVRDRLVAEYWGGVCAQDLVPQIAAIEADVIHVRVDSPGGDVFAANSIGTALKQHKAKTIAHIDGMAASAATGICCACDVVEAAEGSMYMIHNAWTFAIGNRHDLLETAALLEKVDGQLAARYAAFSGQEQDQIAAWMDATTWFTAEEAVEKGFASRMAAAKASAHAWNLTAYGNAPKPAAVQTSAHQPSPPPAADQYITPEHRARLSQRIRVATIA